MSYQMPTKTIADTYQMLDDDVGHVIICNKATDFTITMQSATGRYNWWCIIQNDNTGIVTISTKEIKQGQFAIISNKSGAWVVTITNNLPTKAEIEAVLTGEISSHYHKTQIQTWRYYPDTPSTYPNEKYQCVFFFSGSIYLATSEKELYSGGEVVYCSYTGYYAVTMQVSFHNGGAANASLPPGAIFYASNYDIYTTSAKTTLAFSHQNDHRETKLKPLVNGSATNPEIVFDIDGDIILVEVA